MTPEQFKQEFAIGDTIICDEGLEYIITGIGRDYFIGLMDGAERMRPMNRNWRKLVRA